MASPSSSPNAFSMLADRIDPIPDTYATDPDGWIRDKLGEYTTVDQRRILDSVVAHRYTAVPSCHDVGKSWSGARITGWWIDTHELGEAFAVTTAPTYPQVSAILWREIGRMHAHADLAGYVTGDNEWKIRRARRTVIDKQTGRRTVQSAELIAYGRKPADYDPAAFSGIHSRYPLIIIDEAGGVPKAIFDAVDTLATNSNARVLAIGNPDDPASHFATVCKPGSGWHVLHIDGLRQPTMTPEEVRKYPRLVEYMMREGIDPSTEDVPDDLRELLISPEWINERILRWGIDSPMFKSKVRGVFPDVAIDTLINPHLIKLAQVRDLDTELAHARLGVDVARYGTDHSVGILRLGGKCRIVFDIASGPITQVAGEVQRLGSGLHPHALPLANVDDTGVGGGVTDILRENDYPVQAIIGAASAATKGLLSNGKPRFYNYRSWLFWHLRELFEGQSGTGEDGILDIPEDDDELAAQLVNIKYKVNSKGQIQVESKEEMVARGLSSPDRADALAYSIAPDERAAQAQTVSVAGTITGDLLTSSW